MKYISQNRQAFLVVYDYTKAENTLKTLPSLVNEAHLLYYVNIDTNYPDGETMRLIAQKIQKGGKGKLIYKDNNITLISQAANNYQDMGLFQQIKYTIKNIQVQQMTFLQEFRGKKKSYQCNLAFDMMIVNLWRQFKWIGNNLMNQIILLFNQKETYLNQMTVDPQVLHAPKRLSLSQNCSLCLSNDPQLERPRRTFWICASCSAQKQKPIYLCKGCFNAYHSNTDLYLFRKNEKKTKKIMRMAKKINRRNKKKEPSLIQQAQYGEHDQITEKDRSLLELDKKCDQFFNKIDELVEGKSFNSAEFYLQMLMNMTILKSHQYLNKFTPKQSINLKIEEIQN